MYNKHNFNIVRALPGNARYYAGMLVEPKATVLTDGHALVKVTTPKGDVAEYPGAENALQEFEPFVISRENAQAAGDLAPKGPGRVVFPILKNVILTGSNGTKKWAWGLPTERKELVCEEQDQKFPKYEDIISQKKPVNTIVFDGKLLAPLVKFLTDLATTSTKTQAPIMFSLYDKEGKVGMKIEAKNTDTGQLGTVVVMPMSPDSYPETPAEEPKKAEAETDNAKV